MLLKNRAEAVSSRSDLAVFMNDLKKDLEKNGRDWPNHSLEEFLSALSGWVEDMDGYYQNQKLPIPAQPSWKTIAEMLLAAKYYE
jgi:hypothetical protein